MAAETRSGRYILGDSPAEIQHLVHQAEVYSEEANGLFDLIGIAPGRSAIDIGCGVMGVLHLLADRVGPTGRVVGLDRERRMVETGRELAQRRGLDIELIEADATRTDLPGGSFDLVHARTLLLSVANPEAILEEMVRLVRPGGVVAVQEADAAAWVCDPPHPAFDVLRSQILSAYRHTGKDFNIGRRLPRMLRAAGLEDVTARATARVTQRGDYYQTFLLTIATLVRDVILGSGELTADEFDAYVAELGTHLDQPGAITCQPVIWQAWGRRRARGPHEE
jgi:SAM-dependent methyltransferase